MLSNLKPNPRQPRQLGKMCTHHNGDMSACIFIFAQPRSRNGLDWRATVWERLLCRIPRFNSHTHNTQYTIHNIPIHNIQHNTTQYNTIHNTIQHNTQHNAQYTQYTIQLQYNNSTIQYNTIQLQLTITINNYNTISITITITIQLQLQLTITIQKNIQHT